MENTNSQNPNTFNNMPKEKYMAMAEKGQIEGAKTRKRNKKMRDVTINVLATRIKNEALEKELHAAGFKGQLTYQDLLIYRLFMKALGNAHDSVAAFREIRSLAGEAEAVKIDMTVTPDLSEQAQRITAVLNEYRAIE
ncbi:MAG: hypothetical protein GYA50_10125 [Eubacteriaceae bacterium]|nr:hypothetical protein [Eubacteriaceae bacterium]